MSQWISVVPLLLMPLMLGAALPLRQTRLATRWWFGVVAAAMIVIVGHGIGLPRSVVFGILYGAVMMVLWWRLRRSSSGIVAVPRREVLYGLLLVLLLVPLVLAVVLWTLDFPALGADAIVIWYAKAKAFHAWAAVPDLPSPNYPALGPVSWMLVLEWVSSDAERVGRLFFGMAYIIWYLGLFELVRRPYPWGSAIVLPALAMLFVDFSTVTRGDQDYLLTSAAGMATIFLVKTLMMLSGERGPLHARLTAMLGRSEGRQCCFLAAIFSGALGLVKQEGTVLGLILMSAWVTTLLVQERAANWPAVVRRVLPMGGTYAVVAGVWPALLVLHHVDLTNVQGQAFSVSSVLHALENVNRWPAIRPYLVEYVVTMRPVLVASLILSVTSLWLLPNLRTAVLFLWGVLFLHTVFVPFVFLATRQPLQWHLRTAFDRLIAHDRFVFVTLLWITIVVMLNALAGRSPSGAVRTSDAATQFPVPS